jgi:CheY-like chemotaxis protein
MQLWETREYGGEMSDTKRVLIVEDRPDYQKIFQEVVNSLGYQSRMAATLKEAFDELDRRTFHVGLIDLRLDDADENNWDGLKVLARAKALNEGMRLVVLTSYGEVEHVSESFREYQVVDFIRKQKMDMRQVKEIIHQAAEKVETDPTRTMNMPEFTRMLGMSQERLMELFGASTELEFLLRRLAHALRPLLPYNKGANEDIAPNGDISIQARFWSKGLGEPVVFWFGKRATMEQAVRGLDESEALTNELGFGRKVTAVFGESAFSDLGGIVYTMQDVPFEEFKREKG